PVPNLIVGEKYQISENGDLINVRASPTIESERINQLRSGEIITILDGPVDGDDFYWWKVQLPDGTVGWIVEVSGWYIHQNE
ncbi:MAG: SH3 domain-containing protein, partial [Geobacteraceae bacterium]